MARTSQALSDVVEANGISQQDLRKSNCAKDLHCLHAANHNEDGSTGVYCCGASCNFEGVIAKDQVVETAGPCNPGHAVASNDGSKEAVAVAKILSSVGRAPIKDANG